MQFHSPLYRATLLRRYKRFLADMVLEDGSQTTVHCPNPGAMTGLAEAGMTCWIAPSKPGSKLDWGWKLVELATGHHALIDTSAANGIVAEALSAHQIPDLPPYSHIRAEVALDRDSRIDFRLEGGCDPIWLEVKSVSLARNGSAEFPDTRTLRGTKHLTALTAAVQRGERAVMLYLLARDDCDQIAIAGDIDPAYAQAFDAARRAGVQMIGMATSITRDGIWATKSVPVL